jgi:hypothetical protein
MFESLYPLLFPLCKMQDLVEMDKNRQLLGCVISF